MAVPPICDSWHSVRCEPSLWLDPTRCACRVAQRGDTSLRQVACPAPDHRRWPCRGRARGNVSMTGGSPILGIRPPRNLRGFDPRSTTRSARPTRPYRSCSERRRGSWSTTPRSVPPCAPRRRPACGPRQSAPCSARKSCRAASVRSTVLALRPRWRFAWDSPIFTGLACSACCRRQAAIT